jgi:hypothetical protein
MVWERMEEVWSVSRSLSRSPQATASGGHARGLRLFACGQMEEAASKISSFADVLIE